MFHFPQELCDIIVDFLPPIRTEYGIIRGISIEFDRSMKRPMIANRYTRIMEFSRDDYGVCDANGRVVSFYVSKCHFGILVCHLSCFLGILDNDCRIKILSDHILVWSPAEPEYIKFGREISHSSNIDRRPSMTRLISNYIKLKPEYI